MMKLAGIATPSAQVFLRRSGEKEQLVTDVKV